MDAARSSKTAMGVIVSAVLVAGVVLVACGGQIPLLSASPQEAPEQAPVAGDAPGSDPLPITSTEGLIGTIHGGYNNDSWIHFGEDGTYYVAFGDSGNPEEAPQIVGNYRFEDGVLFIEDTGGICDDIVGSYEVARFTTGGIEFTLIEDDCTERARDLPGAQESWAPVE